MQGNCPHEENESEYKMLKTKNGIRYFKGKEKETVKNGQADFKKNRTSKRKKYNFKTKTQ